jgi:hypothetical protein
VWLPAQPTNHNKEKDVTTMATISRILPAGQTRLSQVPADAFPAAVEAALERAQQNDDVVNAEVGDLGRRVSRVEDVLVYHRLGENMPAQPEPAPVAPRTAPLPRTEPPVDPAPPAPQPQPVVHVNHVHVANWRVLAWIIACIGLAVFIVLAVLTDSWLDEVDAWASAPAWISWVYGAAVSLIGFFGGGALGSVIENRERAHP